MISPQFFIGLYMNISAPLDKPRHELDAGGAKSQAPAKQG
jgi:hypothetical protein